LNLAKHLGAFSWAVAAKLLPVVYGVTLVLVVAKAIPVAEYGRYGVVFALFTYVVMLNKALVLNPMIKFGADPERFAGAMRAGLWLNVFFFMLFGTIIWFAASPIAQLLKVTVSDVRLVVWLLAVWLIRDYAYCLQQTIFRTGKIFVIEALFYLSATAGFIYLWLDGRLVSAHSVLLVIIIAGALSSAVSIWLGSGGINLFAKVLWSDVKQLLRYGVDTLGIGFSSAMLYNADIWIIANVYELSDAGIYNMAKQVWRQLSAVNQATGMLILPYAAKLEATKRYDDRNSLFEKSVAYIFIGLALAAITGGALSVPFFAWFKDGAYAGSAFLLAIMLLGTPFEGVYNSAGSILYGIGNARSVSAISLLGLGIFIGVLLPLANIYGSTGAAVALAVSLIAMGVVMFLDASRRLGSGMGAVAKRLGTNIRTWTGHRNG